MVQLTLRVDASLAERLKRVASARGQSVNAYAGAVLGAAVDPDLTTDEAERLRERLAQAGLLAATSSVGESHPDDAALRRARRSAGAGRPLSELVSEGRD